MKEHPIIIALYKRREDLCLSRDKVCANIGMSRGALHKRETSGRFGALEQLDRWAALLGYKLVLAPKDDETTWS